MNLEIQIQSLIFSLVFGMFFSLMFNLFYKRLFCGKLILRVVTNLIFITINTLLYFEILRMINNGIIHLYFIIAMIIGFVLGNVKTKVIRKYRLESL